MQISVVICTHNPRQDYLKRTLEALGNQTLPRDQWEMFLVDNASVEPLAKSTDLSWHPNGRHVREEELGLTPARLRGIREAKAQILVFVDDDTLLDPDYLEQTLAVAAQWPFIGAWGGSVKLEFESPPPDWIGDQVWRLTLVTVKEDIWSNLREGFATIPAGAGMCIRKNVGIRFVEWCKITEQSKNLGRKGLTLSGYEDMDLACCAMDLGLGTGKSTRLRLTHLIPASRLTLDYFLRHAEGDAMSLMMFRAIRGLPLHNTRQTLLKKIKWNIHKIISGKPAEILKIQEVHQRGLERGFQMAQDYLKERAA